MTNGWCCFRKVRRKILNEDELVVGLNEVAPTVLVEFDGMSFEEQVKYCEIPQFINIGIPARTRLPTNSGLMLAHRLRRWTNINPVLVDCITLGYFIRSQIIVIHFVVLIDTAIHILK